MRTRFYAMATVAVVVQLNSVCSPCVAQVVLPPAMPQPVMVNAVSAPSVTAPDSAVPSSVSAVTSASEPVVSNETAKPQTLELKATISKTQSTSRPGESVLGSVRDIVEDGAGVATTALFMPLSLFGAAGDLASGHTDSDACVCH